MTAISWIPSEAVSGAVYKVPFQMGVAHYDAPPPDVLEDVDALIQADRCRFANRLDAWVEVEDGRIVDLGQRGGGRIGSTTLRLGRQGVTFAAVPFPDRQQAERLGDSAVRFTQTTGGRTGVPAPRRVSHPPYVQIAAPVAWTTLSLTLHADGRADGRLEGASPFPRHWVYDGAGRLQSKSAVIGYRDWSVKAFGQHTPWGDTDSPALVSEIESVLERQLSAQIMARGQRPEIVRIDAGQLLAEQGEPGEALYLLLDGLLSVEVDGEPVAELGPGAILGERAILEQGRRTATLRAATKCTVALADRSAVDEAALRELAEGHRREERR